MVAPRAVTSSSAPPTFSTIGCWADAAQRTLTGPTTYMGDLTLQSCNLYCFQQGFKYAGAEAGNQVSATGQILGAMYTDYRISVIAGTLMI